VAADPAVLSARQQDIVRAARDLLTAEGVDALTLGRVAGALGIKPPSLYKHFTGKRELEAVLIAEGLEAHAEALAEVGESLAEIAAAYRRFALANPQLYRLMTERPLPRDLLPEGLEARAAAPVIRAAGGDPDLARAAWAFAHGMVQLELAGRFPPDADLTGAWDKAIAAFEASPTSEPRPPRARSPRRAAPGPG
jgi:AcrR family transcriptional regulator